MTNSRECFSEGRYLDYPMFGYRTVYYLWERYRVKECSLLSIPYELNKLNL